MSNSYRDYNAIGLGHDMALRVINIDTPTLGDRSYLVHDGTTALIIDPQRDIDRINDLLSTEKVKLGAIAETHIHNDYVSGGLALSQEHGAQYLVNGEDTVSFERHAIVDEQMFSVGNFALKAIATPGHTYNHLSYAIFDENGNTQGVFTGGSLLHGATGRPDLLGAEHSHELAGLQHKSARRLSGELEDHVELYPTHGFGSFCSATPTLTDHSNIGDEKKVNPVLLMDTQSYITMTLAALDVYPTYFKYMEAENTAGGQAIDLSELARMSSEEILNAIDLGSWVVDLRSRVLWSKEHLLGTASLGIDGPFASYLGWIYPYEKDLFLISDNATDIANAQRELVRIGIDRPTGSFVGSISSLKKTSSIRVATFGELAVAMKKSPVHVLDVRQVNERKKSYIDPSIFMPFYDVESKVNELPETGEIWVHCKEGFRAASVLGFIESSGRTPVLINESYEKAATVKGLRIVSNSKGL